MANDGALESSHQGEFAFCRLAGGRRQKQIETIISFVFVSTPCQMTKNELPLVSRFQNAIICHQRTKIGEAIEVWSSPKVGVNDQIIVIFAENFQDSIYFSSPLKELSCSNFYRDRISSKQSPWQFWTSGLFLKPEKKLPRMIEPISPYKSTFLHFESQVWLCFLVLGRGMSP